MEPDPVLVRRARIKRVVGTGQRVGYGLFGAAVVAFLVGFVVGFEEWLTGAIAAALVAGSIVLAPSIVFAYGIRAAEREDREAGRTGPAG